MSASDQQVTTILYVANEAETQYGVRELFQSHGYTVHCRSTFVSCLQFLMVQQPELLIIENELEGGRGIEVCHTVRTDSAFHNVPILMIGSDGDDHAIEIQAFEAGVDDFIRLPLNLQVCLARATRMLKKNVTEALGASLSVQVSAKELPGILQYLETELKTGKLSISWKDRAAVLTINQGRLANATASHGLEGLDVIIETLCWPVSQVTFVEEDLPPEEILYDDQITGIIMNCVVGVDEFNEVKKHLPSDDVTFVQGNAIPDDMPEAQKSIYYAALQGYSVDELVNDIDPSERRATMWLDELLQNEYLHVGPPAFEGYRKLCHDFYGNTHLDKRLSSVRANFAQLQAPINSDVAVQGVGPADWFSPVPRLLVVGDNREHMREFEQALQILYANLTHKRLPSHHLSRHTEAYRFDFGHKAAFDVVVMPSFLRQDFYMDINDALEDTFAILHFTSAQDRDTCRTTRRIHKVLRHSFKGVYCHVVPRVRGREGKFMFKVNCQHCGFKLAVDMDEAGFSGECPVCSKTISIPDSMDNLSHVLHLPSELPVVTIEPAEAIQSRDLMLLVFDTVLNYCTAPDTGGITDELRTELRGRLGGRQMETQIEVAETQYINMAQQVPDAEPAEPEPPEEEADLNAMGFAPIPQNAPGDDSGEGDSKNIDEILSLLNKEDPVDASKVDINEMLEDELQSEDDGEGDDIDDFIRSIEENQ